jgi:hypothetical protein
MLLLRPDLFCRKSCASVNSEAENTKVVMNPTDDLQEGVQVQAKSAPQPKKAGAGRQ